MTKVSNCGHDEKWGARGGKAGDQTGSEWWICNWYDFGQDCVLWHPDQKVNELVADLACEAAANDKVGYDQNQRLTFWTQLSKTKSKRPADIKTACEADCSSGTAAIVKAAGHILGDAKLKAVSPDCWTGNLKAALVNAGYRAYTSAKYTDSGDYVPRGSINLNQAKHVNVNVTKGPKYGQKPTSKTGTYKAKSKIVVREGDTLLFKPKGTIAKGSTFSVSAISDRGWGYVAKMDGWADLGKAAKA